MKREKLTNLISTGPNQKLLSSTGPVFTALNTQEAYTPSFFRVESDDGFKPCPRHSSNSIKPSPFTSKIFEKRLHLASCRDGSLAAAIDVSARHSERILTIVCKLRRLPSAPLVQVQCHAFQGMHAQS